MTSTVPRYFNDGDFTSPKQNGSTVFRYPFFDKGDDVSFEADITFRVDYASFVAPAKMTTRSINHPRTGASTTCYLVEVGELQIIGQGLVEYKTTWVNIPASRDEYGSIVWAAQFLRTILDTDTSVLTASVSEISINLACRIHFEYSTSVPTTDIAPQVQVINTDGVNLTTIYKFGGWGTLTPESEILAKGSETQIYKCGIYCKISTFITVPAWT